MAEVAEVDDKTKNININLTGNELEGDIAQRLVELEARIAALEAQTGNTVEAVANNAEENAEPEITEEDIAAAEEAGETQAEDEAAVEEVYEDEEDIVNLRGNLKKDKRLRDRRFNLAGYVAQKTNQRKPENLREANAVMAVFRRTYSGLKSKSGKWTGDGLRLNTRGNGKTPLERLNASKFGGKSLSTIFTQA